MSNMTDYSPNANHKTNNLDYSSNANHSTNYLDMIKQSANADCSGIQATSSPQNFQNDFKFDHRGIHIANVNIRHLKPKIDQIKIMLQGSSIDIFGICETFLSKSDDDKIV